MATTIKFGTDGWRGLIARDFTFENVQICTQGVAEYLLGLGTAQKGLVVGYDTRFLSEDFAAAVAEVAAGNGITTFLCQRAAPTPVISYEIIARQAAGGVIITASHNPPQWNGYKYKPDYGGSASTEVVAAIEQRLPDIAERQAVKRMTLAQARKQGLVQDIDPDPPYLANIQRLVDLDSIRHAGFRLVVDSMYGSGAGYFARLLAGGSTKITEINGERNPLFPGMHQPEPIPKNLRSLMKAVPQESAIAGLATDGDADRLGVVDEHGGFLTPLQIFALLTLYLLEVKAERGPIVKSTTTTSMVRRLGELFGVPVYETPVGFKYLAPKMMEVDALIGGEESGGYGFRRHVPERDGILAGLYFLDLMAKKDRSPTQLLKYLYDRVGPHHYDRLDLDFPPEQREALMRRLEQSRPQRIKGIEVTAIDRSDGHRFILKDGSWLFIRFSGTEPVLRIYAEAESLLRVAELLAEGRVLVGV